MPSNIANDKLLEGSQQYLKGTQHLYQYPSLIVFDSETISRLELPSEKGGGMVTWIQAVGAQSMLYVGNQVYQKVEGTIAEESRTISLKIPLLPTKHSVRFNILVVLQGQGDKNTGLMFSDIANIVHEGLRALGKLSRIVYCVNLATDACFLEGEQLIVLAAHNLAIYFTLEGALAVLEGNLLPPDSGVTRVIEKHWLGISLVGFFLKRVLVLQV